MNRSLRLAVAESHWSTLHRYDEGPTAFLRYLNPTVKQVVPKRAFTERDL